MIERSTYAEHAHREHRELCIIHGVHLPCVHSAYLYFKLDIDLLRTRPPRINQAAVCWINAGRAHFRPRLFANFDCHVRAEK